MAGVQRRERKTLSKSILEMKFMQKSKEAAMKEAEEAEGMAACSGELTEALRAGGARTVLEPSFVPCEDLISPRQSFHGANSEVERLLSEKEGKEIAIKEEDVDVTAEEVAHLTHASNKLKPPRKKARFMRPRVDDN